MDIGRCRFCFNLVPLALRHVYISYFYFSKGSSKQRNTLRRKISSNKAELKERVNDYNILSPTSCLVVADVEYGKFSWQSDNQQHGIPVRVKKSVVEQQMEGKRYDEEIDLVKKEMENYLRYYKSVVIPKLELQKEYLTSIMLTDFDRGSDEGCSESNTGKYSFHSTEKSIVRGKLALSRRGIDYAFNQLSFGVDIFRRVLDSSASEGILEELEHALNLIDDEQNDEYEDDRADDDENDEDISINLNMENEGGIPVEVEPELDGHCTIWKLPFEINQGSVSGRNGSNACSLIALLIGHVVQAQRIPFPDDGPLSPLWLRLLVRCMELGNKVYDDYRDNLPARYLSTAEACEIVSGIVSLTPDSPLPVRLVDSHHPSTVAAQLHTLLDDSAHKFAVLTISDRSSVFVLRPPLVIFIDSHCHIPNGAIIIKGNREFVNEFCHRVWDSEELAPETFGNLTVLLDTNDN